MSNLRAVNNTPAVKKFKSTSDLNDVVDDEVEHYTMILGVMSLAWKNLENNASRGVLALEIDDVCKLALTTTKILEARRKCIANPSGRSGAEAKTPGIGYSPYIDE